MIFKAWDTANKGFISVEELTEKLIGLSLSTTSKFASLLLMTISKNSEILTLKGFLKVFEYDRIGQLACEAIRRDYMETQRKLYDQIKQ